MRARPEEALHRTIADFLNCALPYDAFWWHTPNGGGRSKAEAGIFKALGVKAGFPDIGIVWRSSWYFIELKATRGRVSDAQDDVLGILSRNGAFTAICRSPEAVEHQLQTWRIPLSARISA